MSINIVLINFYSGSLKHGMEYRPYYLARHWASAGYNAHVFAASFSHLRAEQPQARGVISQEEIDGIRFHWFRSLRYKGVGLWRVVAMFWFSALLTLLAPWLALRLRPKIVIASSPNPTDAIPAWALARISGAKFVFEVRDIWPLSIVELAGTSTRHPFIILLQFIENWAYRACDHCVSLLPRAISHMRDHGLTPEKFLLVPNGIEATEWSNANQVVLPQEISQEIARIRARSRFVVGYIGTHGIANSLESFIDAAARLKNDGIGFVLVGDGHLKSALMERAVKLDLVQTVTFLPPVPKDLVPTLTQQFDALFIASRKNPLYRFGVSPNKIFEYMMSGVPVISAIDGVTPVDDAGCGISVEAESAEALCEGILKLASMTPQDLVSMGEKGKQAIKERYLYSKLAEDFLSGCGISIR